jgi:transcriptional regulator of heat shock response
MIKEVIIANPIYDAVFKSMMTTSKGTNKDIASYFVGTILGEQITDIVFLSQEYTYFHTPSNPVTKKKQKVKIVRLDFVATICTKKGEHKKILIEIQKSNRPQDLIRFRNYLAQQYQQTDMIQIKDNKLEKALPIIVVYFLGFELSGIDSIMIHVNRQYTDMLPPRDADTGKRKKRAIRNRHPFIEGLTHDGYFIQIPRINEDAFTNWEQCSELEKMLSLFEQDYFVDKDKTIKKFPYPITDKNLKKMVDTLEVIAKDQKLRRIIQEENWALQDDILWEQALAEKDKALASQAKRIAELERRLNGTTAQKTRGADGRFASQASAARRVQKKKALV